MTSAIERLFHYFEEKGLKPTRIEKKLGMSNGYLGKMKNRKASIGSDIIETIVSNFSDLSIEWLITGNGDMYKTEKEVFESSDKAIGRLIEEVKNLSAENERLKIENEKLKKENKSKKNPYSYPTMASESEP